MPHTSPAAPTAQPTQVRSLIYMYMYVQYIYEIYIYTVCLFFLCFYQAPCDRTCSSEIQGKQSFNFMSVSYLYLHVEYTLDTCLYLINMRGFSRSHCIFFRGYFTHTHRRFKMTLNADVMAYLHLK